MRETAAAQLPDQRVAAVRRPERDAALEDLQTGSLWVLDCIARLEQIRNLDRPAIPLVLRNRFRLEAAFDERGG
jgi:hypothetical protein